MDISILVQSVELKDYADILLMSVIVYSILNWFRSTRAAFIFTGIVIVVGIYVMVQQLELVMTSAVLEKFFAVILIALVVIFQEELRGFFERLAVWSFDNRFGQTKKLRLTRPEVDVIVRSVQDMARKRIGALIILKGRDMISRHLDGGIDLDGRLSEQLLMSLFDPHSIGHDGAAIIEGNRLTEFSCHLPLSKNLSKIKKSGTRHAAALGLVERCDAMAIVVSEERGTISIARNGEIEVLQDPSRLSFILERFYRETYPSSRSRNPWFVSLWKDHWKEKLTAVFLSFFLWAWLVYIPASIIHYVTLPVDVATLEGWEVEYVEPSRVTVALEAPRGVFLMGTYEDAIRATINPEMKSEVQQILLDPNVHFVTPPEISLRIDQQETVTVQLRQDSGSGSADQQP